MGKKVSAEATVRDIRRQTRQQHNAEEKIRIVLEGLRGEESIADLVVNFAQYFDACEADIEEQNRLIGKIIERVYIEDGEVTAVTFRADVHVVLTRGAGIDGGAWVHSLDEFAAPSENENGEPFVGLRPWRESNPRPTV